MNADRAGYGDRDQGGGRRRGRARRRDRRDRLADERKGPAMAARGENGTVGSKGPRPTPAGRPPHGPRRPEPHHPLPSRAGLRGGAGGGLGGRVARLRRLRRRERRVRPAHRSDRQRRAAGRWSSPCAPSTTPFPGIGHACGHNVIAASAVGTGLALARIADDLGHHRQGDRHSGRGGRRGQDLHARARCVRGRRRGDDGPPGTGRADPDALPRRVTFRRPLHGARGPRLGVPRGGSQRRRRPDRGPGRHRAAATAVPAARIRCTAS